MGDPDGYTPMDNVPEFARSSATGSRADVCRRMIWKTYMDPAHAFEPQTDWAPPPAPARPPARLYLPGDECLRRVVGYTPGAVIPGATAPGPSRTRRPAPRVRPLRRRRRRHLEPPRRAAVRRDDDHDTGDVTADHRPTAAAVRGRRGRHDDPAVQPRPATPRCRRRRSPTRRTRARTTTCSSSSASTPRSTSSRTAGPRLTERDEAASADAELSGGASSGAGELAARDAELDTAITSLETGGQT